LYGIEDRLRCVHWQAPNLTDVQLNALYNTADVQLNTGGGEGWGLTSMEGALCGVPQMVPDWSATRELWKDHGVLLPVADYRFEPKSLNTAHALIDVTQAANRLQYLADNPEVRAGIGVACREHVLSLPSWDAVGAQFAERLHTVLQTAPPTPISLRQLGVAGTETLESELLQRDNY
jgi:glycosyltransferase involved in cell wall biosynthesis